MWRGAARRSEQILERMIHLGSDRPELRPDTTSFNTVLDTLAKSREKDCEQRAEALLEKMEELSAGSSMFDCMPNELVSLIESCLIYSCHCRDLLYLKFHCLIPCMLDYHDSRSTL